MYKRAMIHEISSECMICRSIPDYMIIYNLDGASTMERYCASRLDKEKERKRLERKDHG
jgi:hypothetical protein